MWICIWGRVVRGIVRGLRMFRIIFRLLVWVGMRRLRYGIVIFRSRC